MTSFSVGPHLCWFGVSDIGLCLGCRQTSANNMGQMQILCKMEALQIVRNIEAQQLDTCAKCAMQSLCKMEEQENVFNRPGAKLWAVLCVSDLWHLFVACACFGSHSLSRIPCPKGFFLVANTRPFPFDPMMPDRSSWQGQASFAVVCFE